MEYENKKNVIVLIATQYVFIWTHIPKSLGSMICYWNKSLNAHRGWIYL